METADHWRVVVFLRGGGPPRKRILRTFQIARNGGDRPKRRSTKLARPRWVPRERAGCADHRSFLAAHLGACFSANQWKVPPSLPPRTSPYTTNQSGCRCCITHATLTLCTVEMQWRCITPLQRCGFNPSASVLMLHAMSTSPDSANLVKLALQRSKAIPATSSD